MVVIGVRRWHEPFWCFVFCGAASSIVPGALTPISFIRCGWLISHFLLTLMIPGLAVIPRS
jgi:hypothetical protein